MPKQRNPKNYIRIYRRSKKLTISILGDINATIKLKNNLEQSNIQTKADHAEISLRHSNEETDYSTMFELNQVIYDKSNKILTAKCGWVEIIKSSSSKRNAKTKKVTKFLLLKQEPSN
ncbi:31770_t:CDS:1, partial [Gigaspora margarita]